MGKIIWSPVALEDIKSIHDYIAKDSVDRAALFIERLIESTDRLTEFPHSGRVIPEIDKNECREIIFGIYRIMYDVVPDAVRIASVVHSARDWKPE
ncbi:MAG: type II toxin-antitoxin system RelE/ParE family toxin [Calditrichaeota bacterium]|nr:MAG: type II toxin-antitoxin system RelE/ParE family toxin [Calditrichota bacterium]MBL1205273.1 type II toxin-antitoxin system RelE/ParE family toxin [Calditrichota bacterium]NOG45102.1 type II toxin-antitoxin system RelE/ParE family toxin [Calditrichota bacterium]